MFENRKHISFVNQWFSTFYIWHPVRTLSISPNTNQLTNPRNTNRPYTPNPIALFQAVGHKSLKQALLPGTFKHIKSVSQFEMRYSRGNTAPQKVLKTASRASCLETIWMLKVTFNWHNTTNTIVRELLKYMCHFPL